MKSPIGPAAGAGSSQAFWEFELSAGSFGHFGGMRALEALFGAKAGDTGSSLADLSLLHELGFEDISVGLDRLGWHGGLGQLRVPLGVLRCVGRFPLRGGLRSVADQFPATGAGFHSGF